MKVKDFLGSIAFVIFFGIAQWATADEVTQVLFLGESTETPMEITFSGADLSPEGEVASCLYRQDGESFQMPRGARMLHKAEFFCSQDGDTPILEIEFYREAHVIDGGNDKESFPGGELKKKYGEWMLK